MGVEVSRVLKDGFYDEDQKIISWVKNDYNLDFMGAGIKNGIRTLVFKLPVKETNLTEWSNDFDAAIKTAFPEEKFV